MSIVLLNYCSYETGVLYIIGIPVSDIAHYCQLPAQMLSGNL